MTDEQIVSTKKYLKYGIDCDIFQEPVTSYARTALWAFEEITRQKSELADLNNLLKLSNDIQNEFSEKIDEQKAEIEELREINENLKEDRPFIKAVAIKEFAERLKARYYTDKRYARQNAHTLIIKLFFTIDDVVEEMTEETE